jgi:hypothetical protein
MKFLSTIILVTALLLGHYPTATLTQAPELDGEEGDVFVDDNNATEGFNNNSTNATTVLDDEDMDAVNSTNPDSMIPGDEENTEDSIIIANNTTNATSDPNVDPFFPAVPTLAPSVEARVPLVGFISLELVDTPSVMDDERLELFVETSNAFVSFNVFFGAPTLTLPGDDSNTTYLLPFIEDEGLMVQMTRQSLSLLIDDDGSRRSLQQSTLRPLYVTLQVTGMAREPSGTAVAAEGSDEPQELQDLDDFDFDFVLQQIFIEKQEEYLEALQITGDSFFSTVEQVNVLLQSTIGDLSDNGENENENGSDNNANPPKDTTSGPDRESIGGSSGSTNVPEWVDTSSSNSDDSFFTTPVIIGIAVGGCVLLLLCLFCIWYFCCFRKQIRQADDAATGVSTSGGSVNKAPTTPKNKPWNRRRNKNNGDGLDGPVDSMAEQHLMSTDNSSNRPDDEASDVASSADLESQAMYSYNPRGDSGSVYTASNSIMMAGGGGGRSVTNQSYYGNDNVSYAYSLEAGIEASIVDGVLVNNTTMNQSTFYEDSIRSRVPIREIPQINGMEAKSSSVGKRNSSVISGTHSKDDGFGETQIETAASDLKLTESELAMLPSNLKSDDEGDSPSIDADSRGFPAVDKKVITKTIQAPSGKLGIVIDTTVEGPIVHNVNEGSRLLGKVFPGDIIVAIDNVDTRAMSASAITALMVKTAAQQRTLTVRRQEPNQ